MNAEARNGQPRCPACRGALVGVGSAEWGITEVDVRQVVFARRQETIAEAARRMRDFHVGTLVVIDGQDGRRLPVGVLTDRDLVVRVLAHDTPFGEARVVGDVMNSAGPFACSARGSDVDRRVCGRNT